MTQTTPVSGNDPALSLITEIHLKAVQLSGLANGADLLDNEGSREAANALTSILGVMRDMARELANLTERLSDDV